MSVIDDQMELRISEDDDKEGDEGFVSRPSSSIECPLSSSGSSSDDEIFWGDRIGSAKDIEAGQRVEAYQEKLKENPILDKENVSKDRHWLQFKKEYGLLNSSRRAKQRVAAAKQAAESEAVAATITSAMQNAICKSDSFCQSNIVSSNSPDNVSKIIIAESPQRSPLNLKRKWQNDDEYEVGGGECLLLRNPAQGLMNSRQSLSSGLSLETVPEACFEESEESEDEKIMERGKDDKKKDDGVDEDDDVAEKIGEVWVRVLDSGLKTIEDASFASVSEASAVAPGTPQSNPVPEPASTTSSAAAATSPVDPAASLCCSSIVDPDALLPTSSFIAPISSTPRASFADAPSELAGDASVVDDKLRGRRSSVNSLRARVEEEEEKARLKERLLESKLKQMTIEGKMKEVTKEKLLMREGDRDQTSQVVGKDIADKQDAGYEETNRGSTRMPLIPITSVHEENEEESERYRLDQSFVSGNGNGGENEDEDDYLRETDVHDDRNDRSLMNSTMNTTLNSTVFGITCRTSEVIGSEAGSSNQTQESKSPSASTSTLFGGVKGVSYKPSPLKSPSVFPTAGSASAKKNAAAAASSASTPGRSVAWKEKIFSSPANSSPSTAAAVTPGRSNLKKSAGPSFSGRAMTSPKLRPQMEGASPSLKTASNRYQPPNKSLFDQPKSSGPKTPNAGSALPRTPNAGSALPRTPNASIALPRTPNTGTALPKTPNRNFKTPSTTAPRTPNSNYKASSSLNLARSPAAAASRGAMMARSPGGVSNAKSGVVGRSPGASLMAPRSPGVPLKTNTAGNVSSPAPGLGKIPRAFTPSRIGTPTSSSSIAGGKRPAPITPGSNKSSKIAARPTTPGSRPVTPGSRPTTPSSSVGNSLTPKSLSFKK